MTSGVPPRDTSTLLDQNRLLMEEIQRRVSQLAAINAVASAVSRSLDLDQTLKTALEAVLGVVTVEATAISLVDEDTGEVVSIERNEVIIDRETELEEDHMEEILESGVKTILLHKQPSARSAALNSMTDPELVSIRPPSKSTSTASPSI